MIRYESIRDPEGGCNLALLVCAAFAVPRPIERRTWRMRLGPSGVQAICEFPRQGLEFSREAFRADPRLAGMNWDR
jgi:hypothetical protein